MATKTTQPKRHYHVIATKGGVEVVVSKHGSEHLAAVGWEKILFSKEYTGAYVVNTLTGERLPGYAESAT